MPNTDIISDVVASEAFKNVIKMQEAMDLLEKKFVSTAQAADIANAAISGSKGIKELQAATANLNTENEQLLKLEKEIANTAAKRAIAESNLGKVLAEEKLMLEQLNKENKNRAKLQLTEAGSLARIDAVILKLQASQRALNLTTDEGQKKNELYKKSIDRLSEARKRDSDSVTQQRLNVGNYQGAAKTIVEALEKEKKKLEELQKIKVQYASTSYKPANTGGASSNTISGGFGFGQGNRSMDQINKEIAESTTKFKALQAIVDKPQFLKVTAGAGDATKQLAFLRKELINLEVNGLGDSQAANDLRKSLAELTDQIADAKQEVKALSSDTRGMDLFAGSVSFAADVFQTAAGAAVLFGASEEDAAEATRTLVAIQSISNGVKGIGNELTTRGTAANLVYTVGQRAFATATDASAAAQLRLAAASKLLFGLGIAAGIAFLIIKIIQYRNAAREAARESLLMAEVNKKVAESAGQELASLSALYKVATNTTLSIKERKKAVNELQDQYPDYFKNIKDEVILQGKAADAYDKTKLAILETAKTRAIESKLAELASKELQITFDNEDKALAKRDAMTQDRINKQKLAAKKASGDGSGISPEAFLAGQGAVDAINESLTESNKELADIAKDRAFLLGQITSSGIAKPKEEKVDNKALNAAKKMADELAKFNSKLSADELKAKQAVDQLKLKQASDTFKRIADDEKASLQERLIANGFYYGALQKTITNNAEFEKQQLINGTIKEKEEILKRKLSQQEKADLLLQINNQLVAIEKKTQDEIGQVYRDGIANQKKLIEENVAMQIEALTKASAGRISQINTAESLELIALEDKYKNGNVTFEDYEKERLKIQEAYSLKRLEDELNTAEKLLKIAKAAGNDTKKAEEDIAAIKLKIKENTSAASKTKNKKELQDEIELLKKKKDLWMELGMTLKDTVFSFIDSGFERQKNTLEKEKTLIDERRDAELARINKLNISEADKADKIKILDANVQAQKEAIARRQKQIDIQKAKADKVKAIFDIGINTAVAIMKVAPNAVLMALTAAIGALQLAAVIARPIPEYWTGTDDSKGGPVWLGERGKELLITPDNKAFETPGTATLANIPAHSKVINNTEYMRMIRDNEINTVTKNNRPVDERAFLQWQTKQAEKNTEEIVNAIKNAPQVINKISPYGIESFKKSGQSWNEYIDKKVRFKN